MAKMLFNPGKHRAGTDFVLLLLRIVSGGLMLALHGYPKVQKLIAGAPYEFADPIGLGTTISFLLVLFAEAVCSILLILGLATRFAAIPLIVAMSVVIFVVHWHEGIGAIELPLMYLVTFITIVITGAGRYSLDKAIA